MQFVATTQAPAAIGPYSQGTIANGFLFSAGQIALDPAKMEIVAGGIGEQTEQVLRNVKHIVEAGGSRMDRVVKTTVFLTDMADFVAMNEVYTRFFGDHRPARSTVAVAGLPRGVKVEIEVVALVG